MRRRTPAAHTAGLYTWPMRSKYIQLTPELYEYMIAHGARQDELLAEIERDTEALGRIANMQIGPDEGALLALLARSVGTRFAVELGTFTGYSAICVGRALPPEGRLLCCEISEEWAATARGNIERAGLSDRVEVRLGPALETLRSLPADPPVDFAFVDADKPSYADYYEELLRLMRPGALMVLDNVLLGGRVLDPPDDDESAQAMAALNERIAADERVDVTMLGVADGITLARVRG
jgi:caffeoyl-CoA O-methyltransferase